MKKGDKVAFVEAFSDPESIGFFKKIFGMNPPSSDEVCEVLWIKGGNVEIKEYPLTKPSDGVYSWKTSAWRKVDPLSKGESTEASRSLVKTLHVEKIGTRKDKYLEEERELVINEDF